MKKVLVTGAGGQLGRCLLDRLLKREEFEFLGLTSSDLDIADIGLVREAFNKFRPEIVVNAAAYTAVDRAESEPDQARRVNELGAENLARLSAEIGALLIHVSTDYVFDGRSDNPYQETDPVAPIGVYGQTKLAGEKAIASFCPGHIILRTAWVYSEYGNNFVKTMLRLAETRNEVSVVNDQLGCPTYAGDLADAIVQICGHRVPEENLGIYHYCGATRCNWAEFARLIFREAKVQGLVSQEIHVNEIPTSAYPTAAGRPAYSVLDCHKAVADLALQLRSLDESLPGVIRALKTQ